MAKRYKGISKRGRELLNREESADVDFKRNEKFDSEDIVAFANSSNGGAILLGVDETTDSGGRQVATIVGCRLTDKLRLTIENRALACSPPVHVKIFEENGSRIPFIRIEIAAGDSRPYCTGNGTYKIRGDGRNKALLPDAILQLLLASESAQFIGRFQHAATSLRNTVSDLRESVEAEFRNMYHDVHGIRRNVESAVQELAGEAADANEYAEDAATDSRASHQLLNDSAREIEELQYRLRVVTAKLDSLLLAADAEDRSLELLRWEMQKMAIALRSDTDGEVDIMETLRRAFPTAPESILRELSAT